MQDFIYLPLGSIRRSATQRRILVRRGDLCVDDRNPHTGVSRIGANAEAKYGRHFIETTIQCPYISMKAIASTY